MSPAETAEPIEKASGLWIGVGPRIHVSDGGPDPPCEEAVLRGGAAHCKVGTSAVSCAKTAEPIEMSFWNMVLDSRGSKEHY